MPRQRKAQNGAQRIGTGRVANTTTGSTTTQTVYRIPTRGAYGECEKLAYEVIGTSPIEVAIEGENIYRISLDTASLKNVIESYSNLDLSNVTLTTVNGDVEFTGSITADGTFTAAIITATNGTINTLTSTTGTIESLGATSASIVTLDATSLSSTNANIAALSSDSITMNEGGTITTENLSVTDNATIASASITDATVSNLTTTTSAQLSGLAVSGTSEFTGAVDINGGATANALTVENSLTVDGTSTFTGAVSTVNISSSGAATLNNLAVSGNETVTGNATFSGNATVTGALTANGDIIANDDLTVNGETSLNNTEIAGTLRVDRSITGADGLTITGQADIDVIRADEVVTEEARVTTGLYLSQGAEAPDFVLQAEKGEPNGVCPLNANAKVDTQYLPPIYTSAIVKVGTGIFSNSQTSIVSDDDITADSFVAISNYQDIVGDLEETINTGQLTVVSNQVETGSYKYIVVNALTNCD